MAAAVEVVSVAGDAGALAEEEVTVSVAAAAASAEVQVAVSAAAQQGSAAELVAVPVVLVAVDSTLARGTAPVDEAGPALAEPAADGLAVQDSEVRVRLDPVLADRAAQGSADQARRVLEVVDPVAASAVSDPQDKRRVSLPHPAPVN